MKKGLTLEEAFKALNGRINVNENKKTLKEENELTLAQFNAQGHDITSDAKSLTDPLFNKWLNVKEIKEFSSRSMYNQLKSDPKKVIKLFYGDIGDGHGDFVSYIMTIDNKLYQVSDSSNGSNIGKIKNYQDFKHAVAYDDQWQKMTLETIDTVKFDSAIFVFQTKKEVLAGIKEVIDNGYVEEEPFCTFIEELGE